MYPHFRGSAALAAVLILIILLVLVLLVLILIILVVLILIVLVILVLIVLHLNALLFCNFGDYKSSMPQKQEFIRFVLRENDP